MTDEAGQVDDTAAAVCCSGCGHPLEADDREERCPTCGLPIAVSFCAANEAERGDDHAVLGHDVICRKCGYNLRGLPRDGRCPECAAPVALSVREDFLCFAAPDHVLTLARGNRWILRGLNLAVVAFIVFFLIVLLLIATGSANNAVGSLSDTLEDALGAVLLLVIGIGVLMFLFGLWCITAAEPSTHFAPQRVTARRWARLALLVALLGKALDWIVASLGPPVIVTALFRLFALAFGVIGIVGLVTYFRYLRGLLERLPDRRLAERTRLLGRQLAVAIGVFVFFDALSSFAQWGPVLVQPGARIQATASAPALPTGFLSTTTFSTVRTCVLGVAGLAVLVLFLGAVRLHSRLRKPLDQQAALAARHWSVAAHVPSGPTNA